MRKGKPTEPTTRSSRRGRSQAGGLATIAGAAAAALLAVAAAWLLSGRASGPPPETTPLAAPRMKDLEEFGEPYRSEMLWGSYRSGLYFGMRTRTEFPLLTGLVWFDPDDTVNPLSLRHEAQQGDRLSRYGWLKHDGRRYGVQELVDGDYAITVTMVKAPDAAGAGYGGDWSVRLAAARSPRAAAAVAAAAAEGEPAPYRRLSLLWYVLDGRLLDAELEAFPEGHSKKLGQGVVLAAGDHSDVGGAWALRLLPVPSAAAAPAARVRCLGLQLAEEGHIPMIRDVIRNALIAGYRKTNGKLVLPNDVADSSNLAAVQLTLELPADVATSFDLVFQTQPERATAGQRLSALSGDGLTALIEERDAAFDSRFDRAFPITAPAGASDADAAALRAASAAALSNLVGSMGYFVGESLVQLPARRGAPAAVVPNWREALYTCTPSRSFFPRGFLWDEGFHQLLLQQWDPRLSRDAMGHWLDLLNAQGWIPREQILGSEARARVPAEFVVQHPTHANPPSLVLPLAAMADALERGDYGGGAESEVARAWLGRAWPRLEAWYAWFNRTQAGPKPGSYRWHGRNETTDLELNPKTLTSGLDDYPRASHPSNSERHVDLLCWMAAASRAMARIGAAAGAPAGRVREYAAAAAALGALHHLKALHHHADSGEFRDWGLHTEAVALEPAAETAEDGTERTVYHRAVREPPTPQLVPQFGYVSLFPLLMQLLPPESPELGRQIQLLGSEDLLWTPYGLRSLARNSSIYKQRNTEHDPPYWRGQIWVNINYLALRALSHYASSPGPHAAAARDAYSRLRVGLAGNLAAQYRRTGYLWEQYDDGGGGGLSSHPFTGWTALLTLAAAEVY